MLYLSHHTEMSLIWGKCFSMEWFPEARRLLSFGRSVKILNPCSHELSSDLYLKFASIEEQRHLVIAADFRGR